MADRSQRGRGNLGNRLRSCVCICELPPAIARTRGQLGSLAGHRTPVTDPQALQARVSPPTRRSG